jgi:hypothetical protein
MACEYICDGCGKRESGSYLKGFGYQPPKGWQIAYADYNRRMDACSRDCIEKIAAKTGKTGIVLPL